MEIITALLAIIAILSTIYSSDSLRQRAESSDHSLLGYLFSTFDMLLLSSLKNNKEKTTKDTVDFDATKCKTFFDESNPAYKWLGMDSPIEHTSGKVFFLDIDGIKNAEWGTTLIGMGSAFVIVLVGLFVALVALAVFKGISGGYIEASIYVLLSLLFVLVSIKSEKKLSAYFDDILKSINSAMLLVLFTKKFIIFQYGRSRQFYRTNDVLGFLGQSSSSFEKLIIKTKTRTEVMVHHPIFYKNHLKHEVDFVHIASILDEQLTSVKQEANIPINSDP